MESLSEAAIQELAKMFGVVKARLGWEKLFKRLLGAYQGYPSKAAGIEYLLRENRGNIDTTRYIAQILVHEHQWVAHENRQQINDLLGAAGLSFSDDGVVRQTGTRASILNAGPLINTLSQKRISQEDPQILSLFSHHLTKAVEHYHGSHWDDVVGQLRKALEVLIDGVSKQLAVQRQEKIPARQAKPTKEECASYIGTHVIGEELGKVLYRVFAVLSSNGAHAGIATPEEASYKKELALSTIAYLLLRLP